MTRMKRYRRTRRNGWKRLERMYSATEVPWDDARAELPPGVAEAFRETPTRALSLESDLLVPLGQAVTFGLMAATSAAVLVWYTGSDWRLIVLTFGLTAPPAWLLLHLGARKTLWTVEHITGLDLDRDGEVGQPPQQALLEVVHRDEFGHVETMNRFHQLPTAVLEKLPEFAKSAPIRGLAESTWTGSAGLFSKSEFTGLMDALQESGIVEWVNPSAKNLGRRLTRAGERALRHLGQNEPK